MVAILPALSCKTESSNAAVGDAEASPTPTPVNSCQQVVHIPEIKLMKFVANLAAFDSCQTVTIVQNMIKSHNLPSRTALDDNSPAIELENACNESYNHV